MEDDPTSLEELRGASKDSEEEKDSREEFSDADALSGTLDDNEDEEELRSL